MQNGRFLEEEVWGGGVIEKELFLNLDTFALGKDERDGFVSLLLFFPWSMERAHMINYWGLIRRFQTGGSDCFLG